MPLIQAVIFNLDGILVNTDVCHYQAWKKLAKEQGIPFDEDIYQKIRGMKRMDSLRILLTKAERSYSPGEMFALSARKNDLFNDMIVDLKPGNAGVRQGALQIVQQLNQMGMQTAVASSSENATGILRQLDLDRLFDTIVDGEQIEKGKPDPEAFLLAAEKLSIQPKDCLAVENCAAGVDAASQCGMKVLALGKEMKNRKADWWAEGLEEAGLPERIAKEQAEA